MKKWRVEFFAAVLIITLFLAGCSKELSFITDSSENANTENSSSDFAKIDSYGSFSGEPYGIMNSNQPEFTKKEKGTTKSFEKYSALDSLGRCGVAYANICRDIMPEEKRGQIGQVKPSGWHTVKYDTVDGKYLYNRCHLIGYQLAGENANERNLITGTRFLNIEGMLPFENDIAEYVERTGHHVLYRVTPVYEGEDLVAKGVQMEAYSVEDQGKGICFNVFAYNAQPGITIDYATGDSKKSGHETKEKSKQKSGDAQKSYDYVINKNTRIFHKADCSSVSDTLPKNRKYFEGGRRDLVEQGYRPCERCNP